MTKTYTYTFKAICLNEGGDPRKQSDWHWELVTLRKQVTDKMEERDSWKAGYAAGYFTQVIRARYGWSKAVLGSMVREVQ